VLGSQVFGALNRPSLTFLRFLWPLKKGDTVFAKTLPQKFVSIPSIRLLKILPLRKGVTLRHVNLSVFLDSCLSSKAVICQPVTVYQRGIVIRCYRCGSVIIGFAVVSENMK
jgi:hypothetical protein